MLISLLQAIYEPEKKLSFLQEDYGAILKDIELFRLSSQIYCLLRAADRLGQVPAFFAEELKVRFTKSLGQNLLVKHREEEVLQRLERERIPAIPLKGVRFAQACFGHFGARVTSDIDILVRPSRLDESIRALQSLGYVFEIKKDHHARLFKNELLAELHWTLDIPLWSELKYEDFWQEAAPVPEYRYVKELSPLHTLYFICLHGARHQMNSVRYLLDIVQVLDTYAGDIDYFKLMEQARTDRNFKRMQAVLSIVYKQFPHLHERKPLPFSLLDTPWEYGVIRSALTGVKSPQYYRYKLYFRHLMFDSWKHRMNSIRKAY